MFKNLFTKLTSNTPKSTSRLSEESIVQLLKTTPEALAAFENAYQNLDNNTVSENFFQLNAKQASQMHAESVPITENIEHELVDLKADIVNELFAETAIWTYDGTKTTADITIPTLPKKEPVSLERINQFPQKLRPDFTANLMKRDIGEPSYIELLQNYQMSKTATTPSARKQFYHMFRQGLDILDIDPITYKIIGMNHNSMGYWLPRVVDDITANGFFKVPKTTIFKVPVTMLQLTRNEYTALSRTTLDIVDKFVYDVCHLDENKSYFIKTGTYSSKYDFRNAKVTGPQEVHELGEYLLFIHHQANQMASPLNNRCIYGVSTTNEWVVREFIEDNDNCMSIYHGMPLHTEYRVFVDFDTKEILGINPYWDPDVMKASFSDLSVQDDPTRLHDRITYNTYEDTLMNRYHANKDKILEEMQKFLDRNTTMTGQWSMDIMQNGDDFWFIDMADAVNSALRDCVPSDKIKANDETWIPQLTN